MNDSSRSGAAAIHAHWPTVKRWLKIGFGVAFIILGILGLFLPVLQGVLFLAVGVSLLASEVPWVEQRVARLRARFPRAAHALDVAEHWPARRWQAVRRRLRVAFARRCGEAERTPD